MEKGLFGICFLLLTGVGLLGAIPIPPNQLLGWLVPEECPTGTCPAINIPVCGTNQITYINECFLKQDKCKSNGDITIAGYGSCDSMN